MKNKWTTTEYLLAGAISLLVFVFVLTIADAAKSQPRIENYPDGSGMSTHPSGCGPWARVKEQAATYQELPFLQFQYAGFAHIMLMSPTKETYTIFRQPKADQDVWCAIQWGVKIRPAEEPKPTTKS